MSSVYGQQYAQVPANKLYVNLVSCPSTIVDSNNNPVAWSAGFSALTTPGALLVRDLGKNVYLPNPTTPTGVGSQSTILRNVQVVTSNSGYYGTGNVAGCVAGSDTDFYTGYISIGGQTYGGGNGQAASGVANRFGGFVRLN